MPITKHILILDDDITFSDFIADASRSMGFECSTSADATTFMELLQPDIALIVLDLMIPDVDGIEILRMLSQHKCTTPILLVSGLGKRVMETVEELGISLGLNIAGYLQKPFRLCEFENVLLKSQDLRTCVQTHRAKQIPIQLEELKSAVAEDLFVLHFQPQIDIRTGAISGLEALVRWQHPDYGLVFPDRFIAIAEEHKLIDQLGWIVIRQSLQAIARLEAADFHIPSISINVSAYSLHDLRFPDTLAVLLKEFQVSADKITLEITESGLIQELSNTLEVLSRLRVRGVQLSIDDFGTGFSMMQQLRRVPATELKIDRGFVQSLELRQADRVLVQKMVEIGHDLGMIVVAEGVETSEQLEFLRSCQCDVAQGYLFSRALPLTCLMEWLSNYRADISHLPVPYLQATA